MGCVSSQAPLYCSPSSSTRKGGVLRKGLPLPASLPGVPSAASKSQVAALGVVVWGDVSLGVAVVVEALEGGIGRLEGDAGLGQRILCRARPGVSAALSGAPGGTGPSPTTARPPQSPHISSAHVKREGAVVGAVVGAGGGRAERGDSRHENPPRHG